MTVTIGATTFDHVDYDAHADVLYLHLGDPAMAVDFDESPEGHALRFDTNVDLVGITVVGARESLQGGKQLTITVPERLVVDSTELLAIIDAA